MADKEVLHRIATADEVDAETMNDNPTEFSWQALPFYRKFKLLRAIVRLPHRPLEFRFADDTTRVIMLRSTPDGIYEVNAEEGLHLRAAEIPAYVRFFFDNVSAGQRIAIVERPEEPLWLQKADSEATLKRIKEHAQSLIHAVTVSAASPNSYEVHAAGIRGKQLLQLDFLVSADGHLQTKGERVLIENLPVAQALPF